MIKRLILKSATVFLSAFISIACTIVAANESAPATDGPRNYSVYVTMPDGVYIALDYWLPQNYHAGEKLPTLVEFTRYWRAYLTNPPSTQAPGAVRFFAKHGYAYVKVDVRGSGASSGHREVEYSSLEVRDFKHVIAWITAQDWSNSRVGAVGTSYAATAGMLAAIDPPPGLKAVLPRFTDIDWYPGLLFPGGLKNRHVGEQWGPGVAKLDQNDPAMLNELTGTQMFIGVKQVDSDRDGTLLQQAIKEHESNVRVDETTDIVFRDEANIASSLEDPGLVAPYMYQSEFEAAAIPMYIWGSWNDSGTAASMLSRFAAFDTADQYIIGAWSHGASKDANIFLPSDAPVEPSILEQYNAMLEFLDTHLKADAAPETKSEDSRSTLTYYTMGSSIWHQTSTWPPVGTQMESWYLAKNGTLQKQKPTGKKASDDYVVDFSASSGNSNRWMTNTMGTDVFYPDRQKADELLLMYTSIPLTADMEITGSAVVTLELASSHPDGQVIIYLETVDPDGTVRMITEGQLRLLHRKISKSKPPYPVFGPYHSFNGEDSLKMDPGKTEQISFRLLPTSIVIPAGNRLRIAIAGHDASTFTRVPADRIPTFTIHRSIEHPSSIEFPVIYRGDVK